MKISEMNNDQACEVIIRISNPISNILNDDNIKPLVEELEKGKEAGETGNPLKFVAGIIPKLVAFCMKDHKGDLYEIISALSLKPVAKIGQMNFMATVKELRDSIDEEFIGFFKSSGNATATPGQE